MPFISQSNFLQALGWAVINSLWQMALLWMVYKFFVFVFKPGSSLKAKSAFITLLVGTVWFFISFFIAFNSSEAATSVFSAGGIDYTFNDSISEILPFASVIYLLLLLIPVIRFIINIRQVILIRNKRIKKIEVEWRLFVKKMAGYLEIKKPVQVWISENISSPVTIGFLKPVILVPLAAINSLTTQQMEAVLLHELAHIKRYDYLLNIITVIIKTIFYYNPFTRNLASIIEDEREKSCDEWVLQYQYDAFSYSSALLALEKMKIANIQLALAASGKKEMLLNRIKKIMGVQPGSVYSVKNIFSWMAGITCSALLFFILFANSIKKEAEQTASYTVTPFDYLQKANPNLILSSVKNEPATVATTAASTEKNSKQKKADASNAYNYAFFARPAEIDNSFIPAAFTIPTPESDLNEEEELQVKQAVEASKKIIQDIKWKEVNKDIADALTEVEKLELQKMYKQQIASADFKELENKLRNSYNQLNWDNINARTQNALTEIKIDSLKTVYTIALNNILTAKAQLKEEGMKGIPDSEITLSELEASKLNVDNSLNKLKALKEKKIIRL